MDNTSGASIVTDHDILIEVRTTLNNMQQSVNAVTQDHEIRIRHLERNEEKRTGVESTVKWLWGSILTLAAAVIAQFLLTGK